ncbi:unnamed protein product [Linum tenue]|uniref:ATP-dependent DNA helicase n=2 Tax=Linum tenue TaxID=586396 RepID=A0AAV0MCC7_9ROSI|nr:unnamed protein product [Linum tenue]
MIHRLSFEEVDRALCDIMSIPFKGPDYRPFGGKVVLLGGDFRQTLPVIPDAGREDSVDSSLTRSYLWNFCMVLHLSQNMRLLPNSINEEPFFDGMSFAEWTLNVGNGSIPGRSFHVNQPADWIEIPTQLLIEPSDDCLSTIAAVVYDAFAENYYSISYLAERSIVTPTNQNVLELNDHMLAMVPGSVRSYFSCDTVHSDSNDAAAISSEYPTEFLNSLSFNGYPDHQIDLKVFTPIILLRNLNPSIGLCNGTRMMVVYLGHYVIRAIIMGGTFDGKTVAIPRIVLSINDYRWPFVLKRRQFPVRLCYAMAINKSQRQTLQHVGVYLLKPVFSHGQLYVAISRVKSPAGLHFLILNEAGIPSNYTRSIVYPETFSELEESATTALG